MGCVHQPRKDVLVKKKVDTNEAEEENRLQDVTKKVSFTARDQILKVSTQT